MDPAATIKGLLNTKLYSSTADANHTLGWVDDVGNSIVTVAYAIYGDANLDGTVNGARPEYRARTLQSDGDELVQGDFNGDGIVNGADLNTVLGHYNQSVAVSAANVTPPTVTIDQAAGQADPTNAGPIDFTGVNVQVADLPSGVLGAVAGKTIPIAPTPADDLEFATLPGQPTLAAGAGSSAANRVDLLTAVMQETGPVLGHQDADLFDLMCATTLPLGERRLVAGSLAPSVALAAKNLGNSFSTDAGILDQFFASSNDDSSRKWLWL